MALLGAEVVRHGVSGYSAIPYGSFAGKTAYIAPTVERKTGGISKRVKQRKHKQVMIDGEVHVVNSPEEEFFLLQAFLDKTRNQYEADILKKKTPVVKKNIRLLATKIKRTENRLEKVEEQLHWRQKLQREDEEILALLAA
jgi:hypothetical protein